MKKPPRSLEAMMYKQFALFQNAYFAAAELPQYRQREGPIAAGLQTA
jgi:hypothetical protein